MKKKLGIFLITILLAIPIFASQSSLSVDEKSKTVLLGRDKRAIYELSITNTGEDENEFRIDVENGFALKLAGILVNPEKTTFNLDTRETKTVKVYANLVQKKALADLYQIMVVVTSLDTEAEAYYPLELKVESPESVYLDINKKESYEPINISFDVEVFNVLSKNLRNVQVTANLSGLSQKTTFIEKIRSRETKNKTFTFSLPSTTSPGKYLTTVTVSSEEGESTKSFWTQIGEYTPPIKIEKEENLKFDGQYTIFRIKNTGNIKGVAKKEITVNRITSLFVKPSVPPTKIVTDGGVTYRWILELGPGEEQKIGYKIWYIPLYILSAFLIVAVFLGYQQTLNPKLTKKVIQESPIKEPSVLRVILTVKNKRGKELKNVKVKDLIPLISKNIEEYGTVEPTKTQKTKKGELLVWELENLGPEEERVFSYKMKNVLGVVGSLKLPKAVLYYNFKGKQKKGQSGAPKLY